MNYLKSHIILISSLVSILISIYLFKSFDFILNKYKKNILSNYSIVVVSDKPIDTLKLSIIDKIEKIDISPEIESIKNRFKNLDLNNIKLPYFYKLTLKRLPSPSELNTIKESLMTFPYIKRVLTHKNTQQKIFTLLMILNMITKAFMIVVSILGFLLILKQLEVWKLEHQETMYIMELFGAPFWFRGAPLLKMSFIDSIISIIITALIIKFINSSDTFIQTLKELNITFSSLNIATEIFILSIISISITFISSTIVILGKSK